jgi:hypothetical protein
LKAQAKSDKEKGESIVALIDARQRDHLSHGSTKIPRELGMNTLRALRALLGDLSALSPSDHVLAGFLSAADIDLRLSAISHEKG